MNKLLLHFDNYSKHVQGKSRKQGDLPSGTVRWGAGRLPGCTGFPVVVGKGQGAQGQGSSRQPVVGQEEMSWVQQTRGCVLTFPDWLTKSQPYIAKHVLEIISRGHTSLR